MSEGGRRGGGAGCGPSEQRSHGVLFFLFPPSQVERESLDVCVDLQSGLGVLRGPGSRAGGGTVSQKDLGHVRGVGTGHRSQQRQVTGLDPDEKKQQKKTGQGMMRSLVLHP